MGLNTYHYFGAYAKIKIKPIVETVEYAGCADGHTFDTPFCPECGKPSQVLTEVRERRFGWLDFVDSRFGNEWEDMLNHITPPSMWGDYIVVADNMTGNSAWMSLGGNWPEDSDQLVPFPSLEQIHAMIADFETRYAAQLLAIHQSPLVEEMEIGAGYVLNAEY